MLHRSLQMQFSAHSSPPSAPSTASPSRNSKPSPRPRSASADIPAEPTFICTICWQPQHPPSTPKLLGTSSRIVCRPCWKAVLDLSICWVCGECIVRGDEVVSLGWCFWHRGCFGCLVCGKKMNLDKGDGHGKWDGSDEGAMNGKGTGKEQKRKTGIELETIPLCVACAEDTEGQNDTQVLKRGLETVSRFDGGLSKDRLDMLTRDEEDDERTKRSSRWKTPRRFKGSSGLERDLNNFINGSSGSFQKWSEHVHSEDDKSLLGNAVALDAMESGSSEGDHHHSDEERTACEHHSGSKSKRDVYLSIFNPTGEAAFKPSKTKPLPKWMSILPCNIYKAREEQMTRKRSDTCPPSLPESESPRASADRNDDWSIIDQQSDSIPSSDSTTPRALSRTPSQPIDMPEPTPRRIRRGATISIGSEPTREDDYRDMVRKARKAHTAGPDELPPFSPPRPKTPYPLATYPGAQSLPKASEMSELTRCKVPLSAVCPVALPRQAGSTTDVGYRESQVHSSCEAQRSAICPVSPTEQIKATTDVCYREGEALAPSPEPVETECHLPCISDSDRPIPPCSAPCSHSSEYIEKYHPKTAHDKHRHLRYEAKKAEPILEKIKRQRIGKKNMGQVADERAEMKIAEKEKGGPKIEDEEYGLDPRREDLNKELRNLFCEE